MTPKEIALEICRQSGWTIPPWIYDMMVTAATRAAAQERDLTRAAINDKLEEVAREIEALERGTYTTAQTPARLVRAMKVK